MTDEEIVHLTILNFYGRRRKSTERSCTHRNDLFVTLSVKNDVLVWKYRRLRRYARRRPIYSTFYGVTGKSSSLKKITTLM